jgi:hypothetical protein
MARLTEGGSLGPLTRRLVDLGVVSAADVHRYGIRGRDLSRSNAVARVEVGDGRCYVIKRLRQVDERAQGTPEQERELYQLVATHRELRVWVPRAAHIGEVGDVLVLDFRADSETVLARVARNGWSDGLLATELGRALGGWHLASRPFHRGLTDDGPPWVFRALSMERPSFLRTNPAVADFLSTLEGGWLPAWLRTVASGWQADAVIHGDLQFDNCLVGRNGGVTFVDWEFAGRGDPAWDLGALTAELLTQSPAQDAASAAPVLSGPARQLLAAYNRADRDPEDQRGFAVRALAYTAARLVLRSLQLAARGEDALAAECHRHVELARALADTPALVHMVSGRRVA